MQYLLVFLGVHCQLWFHAIDNIDPGFPIWYVHTLLACPS